MRSHTGHSVFIGLCRLRMVKDGHGLFVAVGEIYDLSKGGQCPAAGIQRIQGRDGVEVDEDGVHPDHPEHTGTKHHDDGGHHGLTQPAGGGNGAVHKGGDAVGKAHHAHTLHAGIDDGALGGEQCQEGAPKEEQASAQQQPHAKGIAQTDEVAFLHAVRLACAVVLAHEAGAGHIERGHAVVDHGVGVGGGAVALDHERVEGVDACLNEQICNGKNGVLKTGRNAQRKNAFGRDRVQELVICGDSDLPGRTLVKHLADYFGTRCLFTVLPGGCKDISDVLVAYGADVVREIIGSACPHRTSDIITVSERADEIMNVLNGNYDHGYDVGYGPLTDRVFHPTDQGGLIIATGKPNSGKTDFLNDLTCRLMAKTGRNVCYLSFEVPDKNKHMANLIRLMLGKVNTAAYTREQLQPIVSFLDGHMVHLDLHEVSPTPANIIERAERVKRAMPLKYLIIDPYLFMEMETGRYNTETQAIKGMLTQMQAWGRNNGVWVIIVAHPRSLKKLNGKNELEEIDMYTISGSANWANLADFIFSISRIEEPDRRYTRLDMLKVRDQDLCRTGSVLFVRQPCGRYDERESEEQIMTEMQGKVLDKDRLPWMGLVTP